MQPGGHQTMYKGPASAPRCACLMTSCIVVQCGAFGPQNDGCLISFLFSRIRYDLDYLRNWSLWLDLWIILKTVKVVLTRENAH